MLIYFDILH